MSGTTGIFPLIIDLVLAVKSLSLPVSHWSRPIARGVFISRAETKLMYMCGYKYMSAKYFTVTMVVEVSLLL